MQSTALDWSNSEPVNTHVLPGNPTSNPAGHPPISQASGVSRAELERFIPEYLLDCDYRLQAPTTLATKRIFLDGLTWFLRHRDYTVCDASVLRQFFVYLARGHEEEGGRFGNPRLRKTVSPITHRDYWICFQGLFNWMVEEELIPVSPMQRLPKPRVPVENVEPFTEEQVKAFLVAARESSHPQRDEAIVLFLLDTGVRASELCGLNMAELDLHGRHAYVMGKGKKRRAVYFSRSTAAALARYLRLEPREEADPVFMVHRGERHGSALTVSGLGQLIDRLATVAGIKGRRKSTHTFRHTCALMMLRNGCNIYALKELLGHSSLTTCQTYLKLSQADVEAHHKSYSAVEGLRKR